MNTAASMDYDTLELIVDFDDNGTDYANLSAEIHITSDDNFSASFGPVDMMEESDNTSWNTHWADIDLTLFFEGSADASPMAEEGTWYYVDASVYDEIGYIVGYVYIEICMENGSVCEDDWDNSDIGVEELFDAMDANQDGAVNASEMIDYFNMENTDDENASDLDADQEADIADMIAEYDIGYDDGMGDTEDANDGMLEFNEFYNLYFSVFMITGADAYFEDGVVTVEIHDDFDEVSHVVILIYDMIGNELVNETYNGSEDWTSSDCCTEDQIYYVFVTLYDENGDMLAMTTITLGETMSQDEMIFGMYDLDESGNVSFDEFMVGAFGDGQPDNQTISLFQSMFMTSDSNNDSELNFDEFMEFLELLNGNDDDGDDDDSYPTSWNAYKYCEWEGDGMDDVAWWCSEDEQSVDENGQSTGLDDWWYYCEDHTDTEGYWYCTDDFGQSEEFSESADNDRFFEEDNDDDSNDIDFELMFTMFDADGSGNISWDEYYGFMSGDSDNDSSDEEVTMFRNIFMGSDLDNDSELNLNEFMQFMSAFSDDDGDGEADGDDIEMAMMMLDSDGDGNLSLAEVLIMSDETMPDSFLTNMFNHNDFNGDGMLDLFELAMFIAQMDEMDSENCQDVKTGDPLMNDGYLIDDEGNEIDVMAGDTAAFDGEYCYDAGSMNGDFMMFMSDTDNDGHISLTEVIALLNGMNAKDNQEPLSDLEEEWMSIAFMMSDSDGDELLDEDEFMEFYYKAFRDDNDEDDHDEEYRMECHDVENMMPMEDYDNMMECEAAGFSWIEVHEDDHDHQDDDQAGNDDEDQGSNDEDMINFYDVDVWFQQWDDQTMELVIVELGVIDSAEEIARMVTLADQMYGNNDTQLDQAEVDMLMGLYAMSLNPEDMADGLTLDGQNGTAVDFWVEVDGLLEGEDVVFLRLGTVIAFPTTPYDNSTTHTFVVNNDEEDDASESMSGSMDESMDESMPCEDEFGVWIHNSETWSISSATESSGVLEFTYDETNDMWYGTDNNCDEIGTFTFVLDKTENGSMPVVEEDFTWEDEEMNMFPICDWYYAVNFANGSMMEDQWMDEAPQSGDYMITLVDNASYDIFVYCWDPEGGEMTVDITSPLGNSSNTSIGHAMGFISFKLPAGTGGNVTFDVTWTDGYHTESGTLIVFVTGDGSIDLSEIEADGEGLLPGFTAGLGVIAMLGAAMLAGRKD
jgi:PGF-CTERM protein